MKKQVLKTILCIPTLNAANSAYELIYTIKKQTYQPDELLIIDSSSDDNTVEIFKNAGIKAYTISRSSFSHGGTRQLAADIGSGADIIIFITQDALFASADALENLIATFIDERVGAAYGRQLPAPCSEIISQHARLYNYSPKSSIKSIDDVPRLRIKTAFISNSFAAYRSSALNVVGGFPSNVIFGEDTYVAAKMLMNGWKIAYCAEAKVYHSHNYGFFEEFRRYFDIGVLHSREKWFVERFGKAHGEGKNFVFSEIKFLLLKAPWYIPSALLRTFFKYCGYNLGVMEYRIPVRIKIKLSMNKWFWKE